MTNGLSTPKASAWPPPGALPRAAREAPPQSDAFAGMLDAHQARTAIAEGHKNETAKPAERTPVSEAPAERQTDRPVDAPEDAPVKPDEPVKEGETAAVTVAAVPVPVTAPVVLATPVVAEAAPVATAPAVAAPTAPAVVAPVAGAPAPVVAAPTAPEGVPAAPAPGTTAPAQPAPVTDAVPDQPATPAAKPATDGPNPATPSANASPKALETPSRTPGDPGQQGQQQQPKDGLPANASAVAQQVARVAQPEATTQTTQPAPAPPVASPVAPAAPTAVPRGLAHATPVPLSRAADAVENVLRLASSRGVTHARIALRPVELGSIDVHLRSTAEGLVARVVAHSPEAVQQLQQAANDLRRSLEEQGLNLLNLDIGASGERFAGRREAEAGLFGTGEENDAPASDAPADTTSTTLRLPDGVLVDVLA